MPESLLDIEPEYDDIRPQDSLRFRFRYAFLPPGLIPRFIVQTPRNLTPGKLCWRTGVYLKVTDCPILVRGDRDERVIDISVCGPKNSRRAALNVVLNDLETVNKSRRPASPSTHLQNTNPAKAGFAGKVRQAAGSSPRGQS